MLASRLQLCNVLIDRLSIHLIVWKEPESHVRNIFFLRHIFAKLLNNFFKFHIIAFSVERECIVNISCLASYCSKQSRVFTASDFSGDSVVVKYNSNSFFHLFQLWLRLPVKSNSFGGQNFPAISTIQTTSTYSWHHVSSIEFYTFFHSVFINNIQDGYFVRE